jgi:Lrp/AsnC family transcriptional regulator, leucine-responsive regulatory protein
MAAAKAPRQPKLDTVDRRLLVTLSADGRRSAAALAKELGLSRQAVAERIHDLQRRRIIRGFHAEVDPGVLGLAVRAHIRLSIDGSAGPQRMKDVVRRLTRNPMVRAVHRVSGEDCFVAQVLCRQIQDVTELLADLQETKAIQSSRTAFVLETLLDKGALGPLDAALVQG